MNQMGPEKGPSTAFLDVKKKDTTPSEKAAILKEVKTPIIYKPPRVGIYKFLKKIKFKLNPKFSNLKIYKSGAGEMA